MKRHSKPRAIVAVSGGVDSSVAAWMMLQEGFDVQGIFLKNGVCRWISIGDHNIINHVLYHDAHDADIVDAMRVAEQIGIPLRIVDMSEAFTEILWDFASEYIVGRTPNPCVRCNPLVKFRQCMEAADAFDADTVVTGHYARIVPPFSPDGEYELRRAACAAKDQSYVLHGLPREWLRMIRFPIGELDDKESVRKIARENNIPISEKHDSQDICFLPDGDREAFLRKLRSIQKLISTNSIPESGQNIIPESVFMMSEIPNSMTGAIVSSDGKKIGVHPGIERFTIGQRKGLAVACGARKYVTDIDPLSGQVTLGDADELLCKGLIADRVNWLISQPENPFTCELKIRYRSRAVSATIEPNTDVSKPECMENQHRFRAIFRTPYGAVAPGQYAVMYDGDRVLGGGRITAPIRENENHANT
jgi:Predicted tRNA(5-methylaminomethyl-2-thiouridylate) methyltransferase, contains the PP-loop ATPase domain